MKDLEIDFTKVTHLEGDVNYTIIHFENGEALKKAKTLKRFEEFLQLDKNFRRIHKGVLVNSNYIKWADGFELEMINGQNFNISRRRKFVLN